MVSRAPTRPSKEAMVVERSRQRRDSCTSLRRRNIPMLIPFHNRSKSSPELEICYRRDLGELERDFGSLGQRNAILRGGYPNQEGLDNVMVGLTQTCDTGPVVKA